ncbi:MAG: hypothetical protein IJV00_07830, partial [Clostridia bacterium]|nr:hypothetical protein [Clostridia bacterium]
GDAVVKLRPLGYSLYYSFNFGRFVVTDCKIESVIEKLDGVPVNNGDIIQIAQFSNWQTDDETVSEQLLDYLHSIKERYGLVDAVFVPPDGTIKEEFVIPWEKDVIKKIYIIPFRWDAKKSEATRSSFKAVEGNFLCDTISYYAVIKKGYKNPVNYFISADFSTVDPWSIFAYCPENGQKLSSTPGSEVQVYSQTLLDSSEELFKTIRSGGKILSGN